MTRLDTDASEVAETALRQAQGPDGLDGPRALLLEAREVPLGGVRAMEVHRALPQRDLPLVGAWCFLDRFGPQETTMRVEPHPHIGLQTVTWPLIGEVRHRDSAGSDVIVRPGALNIMTSGAGIAHSEYSLGDDPVALDALQLWIALPEERRHGAPAFERHEDLPITLLPAIVGRDAEAVVVIGEFGDISSPATVHTPIVGAEVRIAAGSRVRLPLRTEWEHAVVGISGSVRVVTGQGSDGQQAAETSVDRLQLLYLGTRRDGIELVAESHATVFLLGGEPFPDEIIMWWNFVGRSHEEIVEAREAWESGDARFGHVVGHGAERIPAPPMPAVRLTRRRRRV
ncbi:MAG: pirin family protein [Microbacterium sp.]